MSNPPPENRDDRVDDDLLLSFPDESDSPPAENAEPERVPTPDVDQPQHYETTPDDLPLAMVPETPQPDSPVVEELRAQLQKTESALASTAGDVTALKKELATIVGAMREIERRIRQQADLKVLKKLAPILPTRSTRYRDLTVAALLMATVIGVAAWQIAVAPNHVEQSPRAETPAAPTGTPEGAQIAGPAVPVASIEAQSSSVPPIVASGQDLPVRPTVYMGTLSIETQPPGASVLVNRKNMGKTPIRLKLRAASHLVWLEYDGHQRWTRVVAVPADQVTRVRATLEPSRSQP